VRFLSVGAAALVSTAALAGCAGERDAAAKTVVVPDVIGVSVPIAQRLIESRGLRWQWAEDVQANPTNAFFMADTIVGQSPAVRSDVAAGSTITLVPGSAHIYTPLG